MTFIIGINLLWIYFQYELEVVLLTKLNRNYFMKAKLAIWLVALLAIAFIGCTSDDPVDDIQERSVQVERPFKVEGSGTFEIVAPDVCEDGLVQVLIQGSGNATHLGLFNVTIDYCTNFANIHILNGHMEAANGDLLYFYNVGGGQDENGIYTDYYYYAGTGRFENVTGTLKLYGVSEFTGPTSGVYSNHGEGTLTY